MKSDLQKMIMEKILVEMEKRGDNQKTLCQKMGIKPTNFSSIKNGEGRNLSLDNLYKIANEYELSIDELLDLPTANRQPSIRDYARMIVALDERLNLIFSRSADKSVRFSVEDVYGDYSMSVQGIEPNKTYYECSMKLPLTHYYDEEDGLDDYISYQLNDFIANYARAKEMTPNNQDKQNNDFRQILVKTLLDRLPDYHPKKEETSNDWSPTKEELEELSRTEEEPPTP